MQAPSVDLVKVEAASNKMVAAAGKLLAQTIKRNAEAAKMQRDRAGCPEVVIASAVGVTVALAKFILT